jgi:hypothetical protein
MGGGVSKTGSLEAARKAEGDDARKKGAALFKSIDTNGNGKLDVGELCEAMEKHGESVKADWTINDIKRTIKKCAPPPTRAPQRATQRLPCADTTRTATTSSTLRNSPR